MIVAGVILLVIAQAVCKKNQVTRQPPVVNYTVPLVGSAIDLGRGPGAFFERAMYMEQLFTRLEAGDRDTSFLALNTGLSYHEPSLADLYQLIAGVYRGPRVWSYPLVLAHSTR